MTIELRKKDEQRFHDALRNGAYGQRWSPELEKLIKTDPLWKNMKFYAIERKGRTVVLDWFRENCPGKRVLDYCCGNGDDSFILAKDGAAEVVGIDISEISIKNCRDRARQEGLEKTMSFLVMDAEAMTFDDDSFDIITEYGALHHLNLAKAYSEISRVLNPDGKCICTETLGHNPLIHFYRKKTPDIRTEWETEHILKKENIEMAKEFFHKVEFLGYFYLTSIAAVPFRNSRFFNAALSLMEAIDSVILKLPGVKWQAWQIVFILSKPKT